MSTAGREPLRLADQQPLPLREQVASRLRHALVAGDLRPGEVLSAPTLAAEFGVSATPVREAMLDLATEGHVSAIRYKGYRVIEVSEETRRQILQLRRLIEVPLMVQVAEQGVEEGLLERSRELAEQSVEAAAAGDLGEFIRADMDLHLGLLAAAGNEVAVRHVRSLRSMTRLTGLKDLVADGRLVETAEEHLDMVLAVAERDGASMGRLMDDHLTHVSGVWAGTSESRGG